MVELTTENLNSIANAVKDELSKSPPDPAELLGSVSDIWVLIALIIPGFITFRIITWIIQTKSDFGQFLTTIYSLTLSLAIFVPIALLNSLDSLDSVRNIVSMPIVIAEMFGLGAAFGITIGLILKLTKYAENIPGSAWDAFGKQYLGCYVKVLAKENTTLVTYSGYIKRFSTGNDEKKDLTLGNPAVWNTSSNQWKLLEGELYLSEGTILNIERMKS